MHFPRNSLADELARNLPAGVKLKCYHISVPPTRCIDIYAPPPGSQPRRTYSESHSLTVSIKSTNSEVEAQVAIFAVELIFYTTADLTTLFVSKADSTGFASLLHLPYGSGSLLRTITSTFISWLLRSRHRPDRRLVLSLFARAQGQYLFPGSVENSSKHVLDDRGLVKWWCKTLDPILREYPPDEPSNTNFKYTPRIVSKAYLTVPGHDKHETSAFFPLEASRDELGRKRWVNGHPLRYISSHPTAPPRCLIPHFPDDPKSRFLDDLDEELPDSTPSQQGRLESPSKRGIGQWKSVRTLEQFWELMAYRQECSSGRLVGFIWVVFSPQDLVDGERQGGRSVSPSPIKKKIHEARPLVEVRQHSNAESLLRPLSGQIRSRAPRVKQAHGGASQAIHQQPETTKSYHAPRKTRGTLVLDQKAYERVHEILLRLDFTGVETATSSTMKWILETAMIAGACEGDWGIEVTGAKPLLQYTSSKSIRGDDEVNVLVVKRRTKEINHEDPPAPSVIKTDLGKNQIQPQEFCIDPKSRHAGLVVNMLGDGLVRKRAKPAS